jgi:predicted component of type VI protein secretion system
VIGRSDDVDLHLDCASVSRRHALLAYVDGGWMIADLGSRNGTWLNGWRLPGAAPLLPGDLLDIGGCWFRMVDRLSGLDTAPRLPEITSPIAGQT